MGVLWVWGGSCQIGESGRLGQPHRCREKLLRGQAGVPAGAGVHGNRGLCGLKSGCSACFSLVNGTFYQIISKENPRGFCRCCLLWSIAMLCPQCHVNASPGRAICDNCQYHLGYPNVRFAEQSDHLQALNNRFDTSQQQLSNQNLAAEADQVEQLVAEKSRAVLARRYSQMKDLVENDRGVFLTFYQQVSANRRLPEDNTWDIKRKAVDAALFPYYEEQITFLCLSMNDRGVEYYGDIHFAFSDASISHRTTVCQENSVVFCEKHGITIIDPDLKGYVATWKDRGKLAVCKFLDEIQQGMTQQDLEAIFIRDDSANRRGYEDFIECHVYGPLSVRNASQITYREVASKEERTQQRRALRLLRERGLNPVQMH